MKTLVAVIVETRVLPDLTKIIADHMAKLPEYTDLYIFHSAANTHLVEIIPHVNCRVIPSTMNEGEYNKLVTSPGFWEQFLEYKHCLIFQADSRLLRKGIEDFYEFDYCGSPWAWQPQCGGNGGCSLRNPKIMHRICSETQWDITYGNEDVFYSNIMCHKNIGKIAPPEICMAWGVEAIFALGSFCVHAPDKYLTSQQCEQLYNQYLK